MDKPKVTPKDFFLWAGAMAALFSSVFAFISLIFDYINYTFPDPLQYYSGDPYSSSISYEMASLIVLLPLFIVLMRIIHRNIERDPTRRDIWVRRWALMLTLFVAGAAVAGDLIALIMYFLQGDLTVRFGLKVLIVLLVASAGFMHFIADMWGYWEQNPSKSRLIGWAVGVLAVITVVAGFFIIGSPWQARLYRFDEQKVSDLQTLQYQIVNYWQSKEKLPATLADLSDPISGFNAPRDAQTGAEYVYQSTGNLSFKLCATFNAEARSTQMNGVRSVPAMPTPVEMGGKPIQDNWQHGAGEVCYERTIDPQRYPPFTKQKAL
jgi:hypothetical protein